METKALRGHKFPMSIPAPAAEKFAEQRRKNCFLSCGIPLRFFESEFSGYIVQDACSEYAKARGKVLEVCRAYAGRFPEHAALGRSMIFTGAPGTGKTMLACIIAKSVIERGMSAKYATVYRLVGEVKDTYGRSSETERDVFARYIAPDLLVLDEVGMQYGTDTERLALWEVMNGRYESMKPTILVSNLTAEEMSGYVGDRVIDRMRENGGAVLAFTWESFRSRGGNGNA
ncbi:ATP-binding protein [uncultured Bilophila sp.]|uniref:ATP-binding protein n=1 Tax=uncultured Bilophila sp. TaxID=529385 RepID=UPI0026704EB0|nr:ATP-binding protein [uncultured Bilophila sp.]